MNKTINHKERTEEIEKSLQQLYREAFPDGKNKNTAYLAKLRGLIQGRGYKSCYQECLALNIMPYETNMQWVIGMFALYPKAEDTKKTAQFIKELDTATNNGNKTSGFIQKAFDRMLNTRTPEELQKILQKIILTAKSKNVTVPYINIAKDLYYYTTPKSREITQKEWIKDWVKTTKPENQ